MAEPSTIQVLSETLEKLTVAPAVSEPAAPEPAVSEPKRKARGPPKTGNIAYHCYARTSITQSDAACKEKADKLVKELGAWLAAEEASKFDALLSCSKQAIPELVRSTAVKVAVAWARNVNDGPNRPLDIHILLNLRLAPFQNVLIEEMQLANRMANAVAKADIGVKVSAKTVGARKYQTIDNEIEHYVNKHYARLNETRAKAAGRKAATGDA
ncbi:MAG: hypothetical protein WC829_16850 [Hyphomicrobium sp.]